MAMVSVATSPVMPDWRAYRSLVEANRPPPREVESPSTLSTVLTGPAIPPRSASRLVASLVSFVDDHVEPVPEELFPPATSRFLEEVAQAARRGMVLDRRDQLAIARSSASSPFEALAICHAGIRQLARGRDTRALGGPIGLGWRCATGRAIAAFPEAWSRGGDPLGDTYHYWANVIAGVCAATLGGLRGRCIARLFHAGPVLMTAVRERTFRRRLFYGNHAAIDRLGLRHGLALGAASSTDDKARGSVGA
ncbi:MAG TPA: hypothetical protein DEF51_31785 [Myxococcales bacterium]|nr:hypothetical protein [Myxococcales bacterium]